MLFSDILLDAWRNLLRKKFRTGITMAGVAIGIFTVFVTHALAMGIQKFMEYQMRTYGNPKVIQIYLKGGFSPDALFHSRMSGLGSIPKPLVEETTRFEVKFLKEAHLQSVRQIPGIASVGPFIFCALNSIRLEGRNDKFDVVQVPFVHGEELELAAGRLFSSPAAREVILSYSYIKAFGCEKAEELLGKNVQLSVSRIPFVQLFLSMPTQQEKRKEFTATIVGFVSEGLLSTAAYFPESMSIEMGRFSFGVDNLFTPQNYGFVARVVVQEEKLIAPVKAQIEAKGFHAISVLERLEALRKIFAIIQSVLSLFGLIAIVVASLGIINTLIMAIHERRHEIGVMKAVGATRGNITTLYAVEAAAIGLVGSLAGLVAGLVLGLAGNLIAAQLYPGYWQSHALFWIQDLWVMPALVFFGSLVGLLAGIYPAFQAAKLDPIQALKAA